MRGVLTAALVLSLPLCAQPGPKSVPQLTADLKSADTATRLRAVASLADLGDKAAPAIPGLIELLQTEVPPSVAHYAVEDAKSALRTLIRKADTVDFVHGREV